MKVLWICGLPEDVRLNATSSKLTEVKGAAWSWILGHLPPPPNVELHILCPVLGLKEKRVDFEYLGVHWHCFRQKRFELSFLWLRFYFSVRGFVKQLSPDMIHGWGGETGCGWLATLLSKNAIVSVQGLLLLFWQMWSMKGVKQKKKFSTKIQWFIEQHTYKRAKTLLVESKASQAGLKEYYGLDGVLLQHPLREEFINCDLTRRKNLNTDRVKFVFLGSFCERKGALDALRAFSSLTNQNASLVMIGDGELRGVLERESEILSIKGNFTIKKNLAPAEIIKEFEDAQFFLLPSYGDTGPTALKEALACGLYPICYNNSGPADLVSYYKCGSLVKTGDIESLSKEMLKCVENIDSCLKDGLEVSVRIREELSSRSVWKSLLQKYKI